MVLVGTLAVFLSEFLTTALLVICSCLAMNSEPKTAVSLSTAAISAGLIQLVLMNCFGQISGAHGNPAVSLAIWWRGSMLFRRFLVYASGQIAGAATGHYLVNMLLSKTAADAACTVKMQPGMTDLRVMGIEFLLTFLLVMAWCALWDFDNLPLEAYLAAANAMIGLMGGIFPGFSANPARTLAPVFFSGKGQNTHAYLAGQLLAAIAAPFLLNNLQKGSRHI